MGIVNTLSMVPTVPYAGGQFLRQIAVKQTHGIQRGWFRLGNANGFRGKIHPSAVRDGRRIRVSPSRATWSPAVASELEAENGAARDSQVAAIQKIAGCVTVTQHVEAGGLVRKNVWACRCAANGRDMLFSIFTYVSRSCSVGVAK